MRISLRNGFYGALGAALFGVLFLLWLWQPERQVRRQTAKFFHLIEDRDWAGVSDSMDPQYVDQWGHDRARVVERMREIMRYMRAIRLVAQEPGINIDNRQARWTARITIEGEGGEALALVQDRINPLTAPFELEWRRISHKPWDWKLVGVSNPELQLPSGYE